MKLLSVFAFVLFTFSSSMGQLYNSGFEEWSIVDGYEVPTGWQVNQDSLFNRIDRSTESVEGDYSLYILPSPQTAWQNCTALISLAAGYDGEQSGLKRLSFYMRSVPVDGNEVYNGVWVERFIEGNALADITWESEVEKSTFERIDIDLGTALFDSLVITLQAGGLNGPDDGCYVMSHTWIDGLQIDVGSTSLVEPGHTEPGLIYPNPGNGLFRVRDMNDGSSFVSYKAFDMSGRPVADGQLVDGTLDLVGYRGILNVRLKNGGSGENIWQRVFLY